MATRHPDTTAALDSLRFPMAICVVFIHSYGTRVANCAHFVSDPLSWESLYDMLRILCSRVFPGFAVPTFFLISGYLFFLNMQRWDWQRYGQKLRRRAGTLLLPYLGWNLFHCLHLSWPTLIKILHHQSSWGALFAMWQRWGGLRMFWDGHPFRPVYENILGIAMPFTGPVLAPLWFIRDLMVVVLLAPLLYWALRKLGRLLLVVLGACYLFNIWIPLPGFSVTSTFWFAFGAYHSIHDQDIVAQVRRLRWAAYPTALLTLVVLVLWRCSVAGPDSIGLRLVNALYVVAASLSAVSLAGAWQSSRLPHLPAWLGRSTFFIYASHIFMRKQVLKPLLPMFHSGSYPVSLAAYLLVPLLTVAACLAAWQLWQKYKRLVSAPHFSTHKSTEPPHFSTHTDSQPSFARS